jgi:hypothetical protein
MYVVITYEELFGEFVICVRTVCHVSGSSDSLVVTARKINMHFA